MTWFANKKIGFRIVFGFIFAIIIAIIIGGVGIFSLRNLNSSYQMAYGDSVDALSLLEEVSNSFQRSRMNLYGLVLADSKEDKDFYLERVRDFDRKVDDGIATYQNILSVYDEEEIRDILTHLNHLTDNYAKYEAIKEDLISRLFMNTAMRTASYRELKDGELRAVALAADDAIASIVDYETQFARDEIGRNISKANFITWIMVAILAAGTVVSVILALYISRSIAKPVEEMVQAAETLAEGDVNVNVRAESKDEIGRLAEAFNRMIENIQNQAALAEQIADGDLTAAVKVRTDRDLLNLKFRDIVERNHEALSNILTAAEQVSVGATQVSDGAQALATGSTEQASSVQQLTASIVEIAQQAERNMEIVQTASKMTAQAGSSVTSGNEHMAQLSSAMDEIGTSSNQIANITKVIEDIAFQTNILALNAAIEAARAGSAGQGFAVVADEVRNLAAKSGEAAKQTVELIQGSVESVARGSQLTTETVQILKDVADAAQQVVVAMSDIERATDEQSSAIEQIKTGLSQVSSVIQTNAATAEENSATSEEMSAQAVTLRQEVSKFRLRSGGTQSLPNRGALAQLPEQTTQPILKELGLGGDASLGKY